MVHKEAHQNCGLDICPYIISKKDMDDLLIECQRALIIETIPNSPLIEVCGVRLIVSE